MDTQNKPVPQFSLLFVLFIFLICLIGIGGAGGYLLYEYHQKQTQLAKAHSEWTSRFELNRLTAMFNYRLNLLREEFLGLYHEQLALTHVLKDAERERLVFYRKNYMASLAVLAETNNKQGGSEWEVQKYYSRDRKANHKEVLTYLKNQARFTKDAGYYLGKIDLSELFPKNSSTYSSLTSVGWNSTESFLVGFHHIDSNDRSFEFFAFVQPSYLFPYCKYFADTFGNASTNAYIMDESGKVFCHSQAKFQNTSFRNYPLFGALTKVLRGVAPEEERSVYYQNVSGEPVVGSIKRIKSAPLYLVAEIQTKRGAQDVLSVISSAEPQKLTLVGIALLVFSFLSSGLLYLLLRHSIRKRGVITEANTREPEVSSARLLEETSMASKSSVEENTDSDSPRSDSPSTDGLGVELTEFTRLRGEVKDLEKTVLDIQSMHAFISVLQQQLAEKMILPEKELAQFFVEYLSVGKLKLAWLRFDGKLLRKTAFANWPEINGKADVVHTFSETEKALETIKTPQFSKELVTWFDSPEIEIEPVILAKRFLGLVVILRVNLKSEMIENSSEGTLPSRDIMIQAATIFGMALLAHERV